MIKTNYFPTLTGIRAIAAFMVFIVHTNPFKTEKFGEIVFNFFNEFHIGVTIFFVLSGFLITYRYFDEEKFNYKKYFVNRFARIYPIYFLLTTATFIYIYFKNSFTFDLGLYFLNITFLRAFFDKFAYSGISQGWTLTVEETFYLLAPLLFFSIKRSKAWLYLFPLLFISIGFILVIVFKNIHFYGFFANNQFMFEITFFGRCFEFFVGIGLALFIKKNQNLKFKNFTTIGVLGVFISLLAMSFFKGNNYNSMETVTGIIINNFILPIIGIAPLFYGLISEKTIVSRILETKIFILLGKSSYAFYLIHIGLLGTFIYKNCHNYILVFVIINVLSIFIYLFIEKPANNYIKKFFYPPKV